LARAVEGQTVVAALEGCDAPVALLDVAVHARHSDHGGAPLARIVNPEEVAGKRRALVGNFHGFEGWVGQAGGLGKAVVAALQTLKAARMLRTLCKICRSAYALYALHSVGCTPCFGKTGFRECHQPLVRVDAPVRASVHAAPVKSGGCGTDETQPKGGEITVRRTVLLMLAVMAAALVVTSGVALAKNFVGTDQGEKIVGTKLADHINAMGGDDVVLGWAGPDKIRGGNDNDKQYGGRGNDTIYSEGGFRDLVYGGKGTDTCYVDSKDRVKGCERTR
jgi:RTX calcium-binding nonapeptide repeat (4 copies)